MFEDRPQGPRVGGADVMKVPDGNLESGHIIVALVTEQADGASCRTIRLRGVPEAPGLMEHVDVRIR